MHLLLSLLVTTVAVAQTYVTQAPGTDDPTYGLTSREVRIANPTWLNSSYVRGRLETRTSSTGSWGTVCDDGFSTEAAGRACQSLGLQLNGATFYTAGGGTGTIYMDDVSCSSTAQFLFQCSYTSTHNCGHSEDVGIGCHTTTTYEPSGQSSSRQLRLVGGGNAWDESGPFVYGRLEGRVTTSAAWDTVCDDTFDSTTTSTRPTAAMVCNSLGYSYGGRENGTFAHGTSAQSIRMLSSCTGTTVRDCGSFAITSACAHSEDVGIMCYTDGTTLNNGFGTDVSEISSLQTRSLHVRLTEVYIDADERRITGRLEARVGSTGAWGAVCDDAFDAIDAEKACRSLGLAPSSARVNNSVQPMPSTMRFVMDDVACTTGNTYLADCSYLSSHNCAASEAVGVSCGIPRGYSPTSAPPPTPSAGRPTSGTAQEMGTGMVGTITVGTIRLVEPYLLVPSPSSTPTVSGRIEVYIGGEWGSVCDDSFSTADAQVACRQLDLTVSNAAVNISVPDASSSVRILMDDVACTSSETQLQSCTYTSSHNCGHSEDVGVTCYVPSSYVFSVLGTTTGSTSDPSGSSTSYWTQVPGTEQSSWEVRLSDVYRGELNVTGRLEVRPSSSSSWGTVCDDNFDTVDAQKACAWLGFTEENAAFVPRPGGSGTIYMDEVGCVSTDQFLYQCSFSSSHDCTHSENVGVRCQLGSLSTGSSGWQYRIAGGGSQGRLEVRPNSSAPWGTVCDDSFDSNDARVACRSVNAAWDQGSVVQNTDTPDGSSSQPIYMDDLACNGGESELSACSQSATHNCGHSEDVGISCSSSSGGSFNTGTIIAIVVVVVIIIAIVACCAFCCRKSSSSAAAAPTAVAAAGPPPVVAPPGGAGGAVLPSAVVGGGMPYGPPPNTNEGNYPVPGAEENLASAPYGAPYFPPYPYQPMPGYPAVPGPGYPTVPGPGYPTGPDPFGAVPLGGYPPAPDVFPGPAPEPPKPGPGSAVPSGRTSPKPTPVETHYSV